MAAGPPTGSPFIAIGGFGRLFFALIAGPLSFPPEKFV
jgi:hypothetical protein